MKLRIDIASDFLAAAMGNGETESRLESGLQHSDCMVRHVCGMHLSERDATRLTDLAIGTMFLNLTETFRETHRPMPIEIAHSELFDGADLQQDTAKALSNLELNRCPKYNVFVPRFLEQLEIDPQFYELIHLSLSIAFPIAESTVTKDSLSELQFDVLNSLVENDAAWRSDRDLVDWLTSRGLPVNQTQLKRHITM